MLKATIQLLVWTNPDNESDERLVSAPPKIRGHYVEVEEYNTGRKFTAHVADLTEPKR